MAARATNSCCSLSDGERGKGGGDPCLAGRSALTSRVHAFGHPFPKKNPPFLSPPFILTSVFLDSPRICPFLLPLGFLRQCSPSLPLLDNYHLQAASPFFPRRCPKWHRLVGRLVGRALPIRPTCLLVSISGRKKKRRGEGLDAMLLPQPSERFFAEGVFPFPSSSSSSFSSAGQALGTLPWMEGGTFLGISPLQNLPGL